MELPLETKSPCAPDKEEPLCNECILTGVMSATAEGLPDWPLPEAPKVEATVTLEVTRHIWDGWIEGPKWARIPEALMKAAWQWHLKLETTITSRWFTELVMFRVSSTIKEDVLAFKDWVNETAREWNKND